MIVFPLGVLLHKVKRVSTRQACGEAITGCNAKKHWDALQIFICRF